MNLEWSVASPQAAEFRDKVLTLVMEYMADKERDSELVADIVNGLMYAIALVTSGIGNPLLRENIIIIYDSMVKAAEQDIAKFDKRN